jgi:hypothetical protein
LTLASPFDTIDLRRFTKMLNKEWKNLANNAREFDYRSAWSMDVNNEIVPFMLFVGFCLVTAGFGTSYYYYQVGNYAFSLLLALVTVVFIPFMFPILTLIGHLIMLAFSAGFILLLIFVLYKVAGGLAWAISTSIEQEKARQEKAALPTAEASLEDKVDTDAGLLDIQKPEKYKWEGPDTTGVIDDNPDFKVINPKAWAGEDINDPLNGLVPKQVDIKPGYKAVPCEGPLGKDICIVPDYNNMPPEPSLNAQQLPLNTYL